MPTRKTNSRLLRQMAEEVVRVFVESGEIEEEQQPDLATSLVRQWITYDGNATLFLGPQQIYVSLGRTPLGKPHPIPDAVPPGWLNQVARDWKIDSENLPDIIEQLNRGQSAESASEDGMPLRLWVNPKQRSRGVEPLVPQPTQIPGRRDYHKIAASILEQHLGDGLDPDEMEELACSVVKQWQQHGGRAGLFVGQEQLVFTFTEVGSGNCRVSTERLAVSLEPVLRSLGFSSKIIPEVIARINLAQDIEFRDREGIPSVLWYDPKDRRIRSRPAQTSSAPLLCPKCSAVLNPWRQSDKSQTCRQCGSSISCA